ncbi:MAG: anti-sigma factor domain-containing protein [Nodosilinea sp.]
MTSTSLPENWRLLLAGYVLDDLTPEETALVEQWLGQHPEVANELEYLQGAWNSLPASLSPQAPPPQLRDRVLASLPSLDIPASASSEVPALAAPRRVPWGWLGLGLGWAATALALAAVLHENRQLRLALRQSEAVVASFSQPTNRLYTLAGAEAQPQASGRLVVNPADQTALIVTSDLPPLEADQVYRLWALAGADPVFCGQFNPDAAQATSQWTLPDAACGNAPVQMLITAEQADAPPVPAGALVLQSQS